ncbi:MAG: DUF5714 domain-containing protein [Methanocorpusculum sp.]|nr:DUF5714 domain-containing protein [Methanocorpusculum sp.]
MKFAFSKCQICGKDTHQEYFPTDTKCDVCGKNITTNYVCPDGHHVCNDCKFEEAFNEAKIVCMNVKSGNPLDIAEIIMDTTNLSLLGCKHYLLSALCVYTAYKNSGGKVNNFEKGLYAIKDRVQKVQTSMCKLGGFCGIPLSMGGAFQATEVEFKDIAKVTGFANKISGYCMSKMINPNFEGSPDCCIRNSAICIVEASKFLINNYWVDIDLPLMMKCKYANENPKCNREKCRLYYGIKTEKL